MRKRMWKSTCCALTIAVLPLSPIVPEASAACGTAPPLPPEGLVWPVTGALSNGWSLDCRTDSGHRGIDISAPGGVPVKATAGGVVIFSGFTPAEGGGTTISIEHPGGLRSTYLHLAQSVVNPGQQVSQGQTLALTSGDPLHFGLKAVAARESYFNPQDLLQPPDMAPGGPPVEAAPADQAVSTAVSPASSPPASTGTSTTGIPATAPAAATFPAGSPGSRPVTEAPAPSTAGPTAAVIKGAFPTVTNPMTSLPFDASIPAAPAYQAPSGYPRVIAAAGIAPFPAFRTDAPGLPAATLIERPGLFPLLDLRTASAVPAQPAPRLTAQSGAIDRMNGFSWRGLALAALIVVLALAGRAAGRMGTAAPSRNGARCFI